MNQLLLYSVSYIFLLLIGYVIFRYLVPRDYLKYGKLSPPVAFLQALLFFLQGGLPYLYLDKSWPKTTVPGSLHILGVSLIFLGLGFLLYGMVRLGVIRSMGRGESQLITSGMYSKTRNPQGIACAVFEIGFFTLWPSWYAAGWVLLFMVLIHMMVLAEEQHLKRLYGQEYVDYCAAVPRYLGKPKQ
jgi:protein-S-isoprenylcysteine O-methyltransferase Ste14